MWGRCLARAALVFALAVCGCSRQSSEPVDQPIAKPSKSPAGPLAPIPRSDPQGEPAELAEMPSATVSASYLGPVAADVSPARAVETELIVARVNGVPIYAGEVLGAYRQEHDSVRRFEDVPASFARHSVNQAISRKLLYQEATSRMPPARLQAILAEQPDQQPDDAVQREQIIARAWLELVTPTQQEPTAQEIQQRFDEAYAGKNVLPPQVRFEYLMVAKTLFRSRQQAHQFFEHLRKQLVTRQSQSLAHPQLVRKTVDWTSSADVIRSHGMGISNLPVGGVSRVLEDEKRVFLIRMLGRRPSPPAKLADVRASVIFDLHSCRP